VAGVTPALTKDLLVIFLQHSVTQTEGKGSPDEPGFGYKVPFERFKDGMIP